MPNDDGEFYQFCYVTHKGEIRGASTPFQFRANSPTEEELLTVEDEGGSDILVVTTKASYLEVRRFVYSQFKLLNSNYSIQNDRFLASFHMLGLSLFFFQQKMEQIRQEKKELLENLDQFQKERDELIDEKNRLQKEYEQERESSAQLRKDVQVRWERENQNVMS